MQKRFLLIFMVTSLTAVALAQLPLQVTETEFQTGQCSGTFVSHDLEHQTTVATNPIAGFDANGGGVAINDLDNDGDLDIVLANQAGLNTILWNEGHLQFRAEPMSIGNSRAVMILDVDGDGWQDIVFSRQVSAPNYWRNDGQGHFMFETLPGVSKPLYAINWADLDGDGDLDLVGATYDAALLNAFGQDFLMSSNAGVYVYRNNNGRFSEERLADGAQALALVLHDLNQDGLPDILVGNDFAVPDMVFLNKAGSWQKTDMFSEFSHSTMSFDLADISNNGSWALFSSDMKPAPNEYLEPWIPMMDEMMAEPHDASDPQIMENTLQVKTADSFENQAIHWGVSGSGWSWSAKFGDLDQDGFVDLYIVNGMIEKTTFAYLPNQELVEANQAFQNSGAGFFFPMPAWNLGSTRSGRGMTMADLDNDGDLDIVVSNLRSKAQLFENQLCQGSSLEVEVHLKESLNTNAIGGLLKLYTDKGIYQREIKVASGYLSGDPSRIHFGFPKDTKLEKLELIYPDGRLSVLEQPKANRLYTLTLN